MAHKGAPQPVYTICLVNSDTPSAVTARRSQFFDEPTLIERRASDESIRLPPTAIAARRRVHDHKGPVSSNNSAEQGLSYDLIDRAITRSE
jgi:hypothetical protein